MQTWLLTTFLRAEASCAHTCECACMCVHVHMCVCELVWGLVRKGTRETQRAEEDLPCFLVGSQGFPMACIPVCHGSSLGCSARVTSPPAALEPLWTVVRDSFEMLSREAAV